MKLTKGKLSKIYNKKKQTMRKFKMKVKKVRREKTFRKKRPLNLNSKTLKHFNHYDSKIQKVSAALSEYINEVVTEKLAELKTGGDPNGYQDPEEAINTAVSKFGGIIGSTEEQPQADGDIEMMPVPSAPPLPYDEVDTGAATEEQEQEEETS
jgi:hypothetical protein